MSSCGHHLGLHVLGSTMRLSCCSATSALRVMLVSRDVSYMMGWEALVCEALVCEANPITP